MGSPTSDRLSERRDSALQFTAGASQILRLWTKERDAPQPRLARRPAPATLRGSPTAEAVAHDLKRLLDTSIGYAELATERVEDDPENGRIQKSRSRRAAGRRAVA